MPSENKMTPLRNQLVLSIVVPAHNEEKNLEPTLIEIIDLLNGEAIPHEVVIVNDNSSEIGRAHV